MKPLKEVVLLKTAFTMKMNSLVDIFEKNIKEIKETCGQEVDSINIEITPNLNLNMYYYAEVVRGSILYTTASCQVSLPHDILVMKNWQIKMSHLRNIINLLNTIDHERILKACLKYLEE